MSKFKKLILGTLIFVNVFTISGYLLSDDKYFNDLIVRHQIDSPEAAFQFVNQNTVYVTGNPIAVPYTSPRYMLEKKHLWCDESAIVLATIVHELGNETRLVDVIGEGGIAGHTYLQVHQNGDWKNYDTVLRKHGITHEQILEGFANARLNGYPKPKPYPRLYNWIIQNNFYLKHLVLRLRRAPG